MLHRLQLTMPQATTAVNALTQVRQNRGTERRSGPAASSAEFNSRSADERPQHQEWGAQKRRLLDGSCSQQSMGAPAAAGSPHSSAHTAAGVTFETSERR